MRSLENSTIPTVGSVGKTLLSFGLFSERCRIAAQPLLSHHHTRACGCLHQLSGDVGDQSGASQDVGA